MKKFKFLAFMLFSLAVCVGLTACSDDDDDNDVLSGPAERLIGTWVNTEYEEEDGKTVTTLTFLRTGKGVVSAEFEFDPEINFTHPFNWSLVGDLDNEAQLTINGVDADGNGYGSWTYKAEIVDNILFLTYYGEYESDFEITNWVKVIKE